MRGRGFPLPEQDLLQLALRFIDAPTATKISEALSIVQRGGGNDQEIDTVAMIGRCLTKRVAHGLTSAGILSDPGPLLQWCLSNTRSDLKIHQAMEGDSTCITELRAALGGRAIAPALPALPTVEPARSTTNKKATKERPARPHRTKAAEQLGSFLNQDSVKDKSEPIHFNAGHHVYASSAAFKFEIDIARAVEGAARQHTIRVEGAKSRGPGVYLWSDKIIFQLTRKELHQAAAVLLGISASCEFKGHGDGHDKVLSLLEQAGGLYVKLRQGRDVVGAPIGKDDLYEVALLAMRALFLNDPDLDQRVVLDVLRMTARVGVRPQEP